MYDSAFPEQTSNALQISVPPKRTPPGVFAGMGDAIKKIAPAAFVETARAVEGLRSISGLPSGDTLETQQLGMPSLSTSIGKDIKRFTPDPETTGGASEIVFGIGKVLTKAALFGGMGGLPAAAIGTGAIEGTVEAQKLGDMGVDAATAAKVGAVRGVTTAAGIALPVAGRTLAETAALVVAGGPASFIVEQQASKMILDSADYKKIAAQYDPFDPVGLSIATLIPGAVGGVVHGARARRGRIDAKAEDAKAADTGEQLMPTPEQEAAARVVQTAEHVQETALHRPGDVTGAAAHVDALELAKRQMDAGEPVAVSDVIARVQEMEAARVKAEDTPGFLRTADDLIALKQTEYPHLTPELDRAIQIARTPGAFRSAEDRIYLDGMLREGTTRPTIEPPKVEAAPPRVESAETPQLAKVEPEKAADGAPAQKSETADSLEVSARQIAETRPDMQVTDEITGQVTTAAKLLEEAEATYQKDVKDSNAFTAAITCFLRH